MKTPLLCKQELFRQLLEHLDPEPDREGLKETPQRAAKAWTYWVSGHTEDPSNVLKSFKDGARKYDDMVLVSAIPIFSHCEHHLAAIFGTVHIAYIPDGRICGLSKFARLADIFARRLQVQERLTDQIADEIMNQLNPKGVAVLTNLRHFCMESRGVEKFGSATKISAMRGCFREESATRAEFFSLIQQN